MEHVVGARRAARRGFALSAWDVIPIAAQALVFVPFALLRYVDGDEGPYLIAAKLVMQGELPYRDFLYTQMPLLPYVWGPWSLLTNENWYAARILSALLAIALGALLHRHVAARYGRSLAGLALLLFVFSNLVYVWFTPVKTQVLSTLLLFGAYAAVAPAGKAAAARWAVGGVLLALAVDTRLLVASAAPAFVWLALREPERRRERVAAFGGGLLAGLLPALMLAAVDPGRFFFDNLGYHGDRSDAGLVGDFQQKARVVANLLGIGTPDGAVPQFLLLAIAATISALVLWRTRRLVSPALAIAVLVVAGSLLPTPTYAQYFSVAVPFLIVAAVELVAELRARLADLESARVARAALIVAAGAYVALGLPDLVRYPRLAPDERIGPIRSVNAIVDARTRPGEEVLAPWPGYLYGTDAVPVPGLENDFGPHAASALEPAEARRYRVASAGDVERMLREGRTRVVVFRLWNRFPPVPDWEGGLRRGGYRLVDTIATTEVWERAG